MLLLVIIIGVIDVFALGNSHMAWPYVGAFAFCCCLKAVLSIAEGR